MENTLESTKTKLHTFRCSECGSIDDIHPSDLEKFMVEAGLCNTEGCPGVYHEAYEGTSVIQYLNMYLVRQSYGGPEEGGWYYEAGVPMGSLPMIATWEVTGNVYEPDVTCLRLRVDPKHEELARQLYKLAAGERNDDVRITLQNTMAAEYPVSRPHYE